MSIEFRNYFKEFVPSFVALGFSFAWGHVQIDLIKFGIVITW